MHKRATLTFWACVRHELINTRHQIYACVKVRPALTAKKVPGLCTGVAAAAFGEAAVGVWTSSSARGPSWQDNEDIFPQSVHVSLVIVWEDEDIINNTALESEWAAVATATQNLPTDTSAGCSRIKSNQKRIHFAPHRVRMRTHANNILYSQTQNREEAPSAPTCCCHCPVVYCEKKKEERKGAKKKTSLLVFRIGWCKGEHTICLQSPCDGPKKKKRGYVYLFNSILQVSAGKLRRKEGRQRLKARTINFPGESVHSAWRARVTFRWQDCGGGDRHGGQMRY